MRPPVLVLRLLGLALGVGLVQPAQAYDAVTHAGLSERAAFASSLHRQLIERLGHPLGLYERLRLKPDDTDLHYRLTRLDPEGGYVPDEGGLDTALAWLTAGAAIEGIPAHRGRNHFFDPSTGSGLSEIGSSQTLRTRLTDVQTGVGTLRGLFTGASFDGTGVAAPAWAAAPRVVNEWGLERFLDERERAGAAARREDRDDALARALIAAGAILHLVEDAGDPALVRNDYRVALEAADQPFERFVAARYGRLAVPEPGGPPIARAHLSELWRDRAGQGLAEWTQQRFFSSGTLPSSRRYALPAASPGRAESGYSSREGLRHLAVYRRGREEIEFGLDERCFADYAAAILPEIGRYATGALQLLFRGRLELATTDSGKLRVTVGDLALGAGTLTIFADRPDGERRALRRIDVPNGAARGNEIGTADWPTGARHAAAVFRGFDAAGEPIVLVQETTLKP